MKNDWIAYLGPVATFTFEAAIKAFGSNSPMVPCDKIEDVFDSVRLGFCKYGIVPSENTTGGKVKSTQKCLKKHAELIRGDVILDINYCLLNQSGDKEDIELICSHPQALTQCKTWLEENFPCVNLVETISTANAARIASEHKVIAAVSSYWASAIYDVRVVENITTNKNNKTKFLILQLP